MNSISARSFKAVLVSLVFLSGCTFTMNGNVEGKPPGMERGGQTVNATSFGDGEEIILPCEDRNTQIAKVRFHTNPGYLLASIVSLGFYVPQRVDWWCGPFPNQEEEEEEIWDPDSEDDDS